MLIDRGASTVIQEEVCAFAPHVPKCRHGRAHRIERQLLRKACLGGEAIELIDCDGLKRLRIHEIERERIVGQITAIQASPLCR